MRTFAALYALCSIITSGHAAPSDDMKRLQTACVSAADVLDASLNGTMILVRDNNISRLVSPPLYPRVLIYIRTHR